MPTLVRYRCLDCDWSDRISVLDEKETEEAIRRQANVGPPRCPRCLSHRLVRS